MVFLAADRFLGLPSRKWRGVQGKADQAGDAWKILVESKDCGAGVRGRWRRLARRWW
jgi:hypothetical protein